MQKSISVLNITMQSKSLSQCVELEVRWKWWNLRYMEISEGRNDQLILILAILIRDIHVIILCISDPFSSTLVSMIPIAAAKPTQSMEHSVKSLGMGILEWGESLIGSHCTITLMMFECPTSFRTHLQPGRTLRPNIQL